MFFEFYPLCQMCASSSQRKPQREKNSLQTHHQGILIGLLWFSYVLLPYVPTLC